ncbi:MAG: alpha/beta hydrolase [Rickettsiales bacterium]|nr:alpha/beta hydrolase [Rickettsiales bacterium]
MTNEIKYIERDNFKLKYLIRGNGSTVVFVIGSHIYYPRTFSSDLEDKFRLVYMDHRGFVNKSGVSVESDFDLGKLLDDIEFLRKELQLDKIVIMGHSIHALMAIEYAKKYPKSVEKLILIAASPIAGDKLFFEANRYFEESVCPVRKNLFSENMKDLDSSIRKDPENAFIIRMLKFAPMIWYDAEFNAEKLWKGVKLNSVGSNVIWNKLFSDYEISDINGIEAPTLLLLGRYDYWNPPYIWEKYRTRFKNLTIRVFEKSSHTPQLEESSNFNRELLNWMNLRTKF